MRWTEEEYKQLLDRQHVRKRQATQRTFEQFRREKHHQNYVISWAKSHMALLPELRMLRVGLEGIPMHFKCRCGALCSPWAVINHMHSQPMPRGWPDLMLYVRRGEYTGLAIEMKTKDGKVSEEQAMVLSLLADEGWKCLVAHGDDEAIAAIEEYLG